MYWVLAAAAAGITPTTGIRVGHLIGRNRHRADAADQFSGLGLLIGGEESVLRRLGSLELQTLVFSRQSSNLVLSQKVEDRTAVGVLVVDDVPGAVLDGIPGIASLGSHVIANALDCRLGSRTLGGQVIIHAVDSACVVAAIMLSQRLFILYFSRFPREFRLYLHPPFLVGVGHSCWDYWYPSSPISR